MFINRYNSPYFVLWRKLCLCNETFKLVRRKLFKQNVNLSAVMYLSSINVSKIEKLHKDTKQPQCSSDCLK